jgi:hypothetical protein
VLVAATLGAACVYVERPDGAAAQLFRFSITLLYPPARRP